MNDLGSLRNNDLRSYTEAVDSIDAGFIQSVLF